MNKTNQNNLAPFVEEQVLEQEQKQLHDILNQFKQPIPKGFVELKTNYFSSTLPNWPKSLSERYSFQQDEDWLFLDIPHKLMNDLGLELGKEIPHPFYLDSKVLQRKPICGGITLENEKEIFLDKPVSPENAQKELEKRLNELDDLRKKLEKEESWWDRWVEDERETSFKVKDVGFIFNIPKQSWESSSFDRTKDSEFLPIFLRNSLNNFHVTFEMKLEFDHYNKIQCLSWTNHSNSKGKEMIKALYEYYKK